MREFVETALLVLNWRLRSIWTFIAGLVFSTIFGVIANNSLEKWLEINSAFSIGLYNALFPVFKFAYIAIFIAFTVLAITFFCKDWKAFLNRRW